MNRFTRQSYDVTQGIIATHYTQHYDDILNVIIKCCAKKLFNQYIIVRREKQSIKKSEKIVKKYICNSQNFKDRCCLFFFTKEASHQHSNKMSSYQWTPPPMCRRVKLVFGDRQRCLNQTAQSPGWYFRVRIQKSTTNSPTILHMNEKH